MTENGKRKPEWTSRPNFPRLRRNPWAFSSPIPSRHPASTECASSSQCQIILSDRPENPGRRRPSSRIDLSSRSSNARRAKRPSNETDVASDPSSDFSRTPPFSAVHPRTGGARRDRTDDLMLAKHALSQLSYGPKRQLHRRAAAMKAGKPKPAKQGFQSKACKDGGPGRTRTSDLTLIKRAL